MNITPPILLSGFFKKTLLLVGGMFFFCFSSFAQPSSFTYFPPSDGDWQKMSWEEVDWNREKLAELLAWLPSQDTRAFLMVKDGKILLEEYWGSKLTGTGEMDQNSLWYWQDAAQTLTAVLIGIAQQEKLLSIKNSSQDFLGSGWTSMNPSMEQEIRLVHHLTMTTGIDEEIGNPMDFSPASLTYRAKPGSRWAYHDPPYAVLEKVLENASRQSLQEFFKSRIADPIGMNGFWQKTGERNVFYSSARSFAKFGLLLLANGNWNQTKIWSGGYFSNLTKPSQKSNPSFGYLTWLNGQSSYRLPGIQKPFFGSLVPSAPSDLYMSVGEGGQLLMVVPSEQLVIVRMGSAKDTPDASFVLIREFWDRMIQVMKN